MKKATKPVLVNMKYTIQKEHIKWFYITVPVPINMKEEDVDTFITNYVNETATECDLDVEYTENECEYALSYDWGWEYEYPILKSPS